MSTRRSIRTAIALLVVTVTSVSAALAYDRRTAVVEAVEKIGPSVVNITAKSTKTYVRPLDPFGMLGQLDRRVTEALGSGVLVDSQGYVITNGHVIQDAREIVVVLESGEEKQATVVGVERAYDLAVLKIDGERPFPHVKIAYEIDPMIGETVIAIGNPYGLNNTVTTGVVSALHRTVKAPWGDRLTGLLQTDTAINRGNSGGPLVNINGELIGVNTSIISESGGSQGIGFAVSARRVHRMYEQYVLNHLSLEARTGLEVIANDPRIARQYDIPDEPGCAVWEVLDNSYGDRAGIEPGDVIAEVEGHPCTTPVEYSRLMARIDDNRTDFEMKVVRRATGKAEMVTILTKPGEEKAETVPLQIRWRGMIVEPLTRRMAAQLNLRNTDGVHVRAVVRDSQAYALGVRPDDVIYEVGGKPVNNMKDFGAATLNVDGKDRVHIRVKRPQAYGGARLYHGTL